MSWLATTIEAVLDRMPFAVVNENERGVFLRAGRYQRTLRPGWYWRVPFYDEIQSTNVTTQPLNLPNQSIQSKDGKSYGVSGAIEYKIEDVKKALLDVQDYDKSLQNLALGVIAQFVRVKDHITPLDIVKLEKEVSEELADKSEEWGLDIRDFWLTDFVEHKVYRIMAQDTPIIPVAD